MIPYLANVHLKDKRGGKGVWDFPEPGRRARSTSPASSAIARGGGYRGPLSVEIEFQGEPWPPLAEVDACMKRACCAPERARPGMIGVAILGGGFMGQTHAGAWAALEGRARVVAVSSRTQERAARVAAICAAEAIDDLYAPLERSDVDVVDICLPTPLHREAAERAFAAGKHVLLEKPIALTLEDAEAIVAAAERAGRLLVVGLVLRFWPEYVELRRIAAVGRARAARSPRVRSGSRRRRAGTTG